INEIVGAIPEITDGLAVVPLVLQIIQAVLPVIIQLIETLLPVIMQLIEAVLPVILQLIEALLPPLMQIIQAVLPVVSALIEAFLPILESLLSFIKPILDLVIMLIQPILQIFEALSPVFEILGNIISACLEPIMPLIQALADIFNAVLAPVLDVIAGLFNGISEAISAVIGWIGDAIGAVGDFFSGVGDFFGGVIDGVGDFFGGLFGGEADVNVSTDDVPQYAEGGIVSRPTLALVGEGGEPEAIIPLSKINEIFSNPENTAAFFQTNAISLNQTEAVSDMTETNSNAIANIPALAEGGIVTASTIAQIGEGGEPEAVMPLSKLSEFISQIIIIDPVALAMEAAAPQEDWIGDTMNVLSADDNSETFNDNSQPITITYSPQYTFGGTPDKDEMVEAEKMSQEEFRRMMNQWLKENSRTSLK
ncbi:MAG: hypothetical protein OSJ56_09970, partial [Prevotella sp.]|nr:hypothetical protein [Prevotella sp.]